MHTYGITMGLIYKYISPSGKGYVGKTIEEEEKRWNYHVYDCSRAIKTNFQVRGSPLLTNAILKYGKDAFERVILKDNIPDDELYYWEDYYIIKENTLYPNGYNLRIGGGPDHHMSDYLKKKIAQNTKSSLIQKGPALKRSDASKGLPMYMSYSQPKDGKNCFRIRRHPNCSDKCFYVKDNDVEAARKLALDYYNTLPALI